MPNKIKVFLVLVAMFAVYSVFSLLSEARGVLNIDLKANMAPVVSPRPDLELCSDIDHDGLCDDEEAIWGTDPINPDTNGDGVLDGVDAAAGCSPLIPSPNNCGLNNLRLGTKQASRSNLTDYFSFLIAGSVPFEDIGDPNLELTKTVDTLANEVSNIKKTLLAIDDSVLNISVSKEKTLEDYFRELDSVLGKYPANEFGEVGLNEEINELDKLYSELSKIRPPADLEDFHKKILGFFVKYGVFLSNIEEQKSDPVKALLTLDHTDALSNEYNEIINYARASHNSITPSGQVVPVHDSVQDRLMKYFHTQDSQLRRTASQHLRDISNNIIEDLILKMGRQNSQSTDSPFFVQNLRNFALEGEERGENLWRGMLAVAAEGDQASNIQPLLCDYIKDGQAFGSLNPTQVSGQSITQTGIKRSATSLDDFLTLVDCDDFVQQNYETFVNDFGAGGGWEMWRRLIQPQNNPIGVMHLAQNELQRQRSLEKEADINEIISGSGFLGQRECLTFGPGGQCVIWGPAKIPSDFAATAIAAVLNRNIAFLTEISREEPQTVDALRDFILQIYQKIFGPFGF